LTVKTSAGKSRTFVVRATYHPKFQAVFSGILIDRSAFDRTFPKPQNAYSFINVATGASPATTATLKQSLLQFSDVTVDMTPAWIKTQTDNIKTKAWPSRPMLR